MAAGTGVIRPVFVSFLNHSNLHRRWIQMQLSGNYLIDKNAKAEATTNFPAIQRTHIINQPEYSPMGGSEHGGHCVRMPLPLALGERGPWPQAYFNRKSLGVSVSHFLLAGGQLSPFPQVARRRERRKVEGGEERGFGGSTPLEPAVRTD